MATDRDAVPGLPRSVRLPGSRDRLCESVLVHLLNGGDVDSSLRGFASAVGVSHSLLLYHFGSVSGLLTAVHQRCERREQDHLSKLLSRPDHSTQTMRKMWRHLAKPEMWPVYRLGFALRLRTDVARNAEPDGQEAWSEALRPILTAVGVSGKDLKTEALLWIAVCRGLLYELVTHGAPRDVSRAAESFFKRYETG